MSAFNQQKEISRINKNYPNRHQLDASHINLSYITHFYCNQENIDSVISLLRKYEQYSPDLLDQIEFIIVDDGSPIQYEIPEFDLNIRWLKINEDIQWNQAGARNLGATYARSDKIVMLDLDHYIHENTLWYMANKRPLGRNIYKIYRTSANNDGKIRKGHANLFFMSRARFMRFYGYDEEFAGHYGSEDFRFVKFHKAHGSKQSYLPKKYLCSTRDNNTDLKDNVNREKSYHTLKRDLSYNTPVDLRKKIENRNFGAEYGHSRIFLNFTWTILSEQYRKNIPNPKSKKWWYYLWYFRWLFGNN
ncbi:putative glycosyltransferase, family 2 [Campylobacter pinnipediorum subsp. caledonicus]|uniref:Putative glycosyltransferase, family 2 n=1 Tax=Campylobacter pinnipediorum subsp. caledonicus TaxID=1874362 RepID=A0A1S6U8U7_9BACT|nr:glycosyltransferase family A protein [Campylobacter pinnipediorum]AQW86529.1 putative glycosyltransferase, family 2 [Campylobacter pinnipediorum subsp. caledonicus]AQW88181.1 putative glycosyltransferase, family 2 [Campylobacter pinnipediorum subsp. caledonicus]OPA71617.1 glycosyl transferase [Campylobacter pinnipediorum subsp. caledonicus]